MKKYRVIVLVGIFTLLLFGCGSMEAETREDNNNLEESIAEATQCETKAGETSIEKSSTEVLSVEEQLVDELSVNEIQTEESDVLDQIEIKETLSFEDLKNFEFLFCSGAGGWGTMMTIKEDGSFKGEYFDGEMGAISDSYPNGTMYQCVFSGQLAEPKKVNKYTYSMEIQEISYEQEAGTREIKDVVLYIYDEPYGLINTTELLIYAKGAPLAELPEEFRSWVGYYDLSYQEETQLPFYGLYNEVEQCGFSSYDVVEHLMEMLPIYEEMAEASYDYLMNEAMTQLDMNMKSGEVYEIWDNLLNYVWSVLEQTMDEEAMAALLVEEREWIAMKEAAMEEVVAEYEGGSIASLMVNMKAADLTKSRVYELLEYLK